MEAIVAKMIEVLGTPGLIVTATVVLDFAFRMVKTEKALSVAHLVAFGAHKLAAGLEAIASFLDKVLPQRVVAAPPQVPPQA